MIAALYVDPNGAYGGLPGVDLWDVRRDARRYAGPWPAVAHPPCARWCRLAKLVEHLAAVQPGLPGIGNGRAVGDDGGTFAAALAAVQRWGGVLEHPAHSLAWGVHGLPKPARGGWTRAGVGWVCEVAQSVYGHSALKLTWLFYVGKAEPPPLDWSRPKGTARVSAMANHRGHGGSHAVAPILRPDRGASSATPPAFRDVLIALARNCGGAP